MIMKLKKMTTVGTIRLITIMMIKREMILKLTTMRTIGTMRMILIIMTKNQ